MKITIDCIDTNLLKSQRDWLVAQCSHNNDCPEADGIINLLDDIIDKLEKKPTAFKKPKNRKDVIEALMQKDSVESLALAYLINEIIPDDRTTKRLYNVK